MAQGVIVEETRGVTKVRQEHGKYYEASRNGRLVYGTSATGGIAIIVAATGGGHPTLFNPSNSGRNFSVVSLALGYVSGANAPGSLAWNHVLKAGANAGTGISMPILTAVPVDVQNSMVGAPTDSKAVWSPTTNTFTAAPVYGRPIKLSLFTGLAATATTPFMWGEDYDGSFNIAPGTAVCLVTQQATTTALFRVTVVWEEVDI